MSLVPVQGGIYHDPEEGRYYHFLLWYCQGRRRCQTVDFATVAEAGCFLSGAMTASQFSKKTVRFDTLTPAEFQAGQKSPG